MLYKKLKCNVGKVLKNVNDKVDLLKHWISSFSKDMENKRTPDALNQSPSDEASPQSNSDNKPTPLDEKDKIDPSSMHTKQATPIVSSHQQLSSMTDSKLEMPTVNTDSRALSSNKEFPPPSISELSSRSGIKSTSSDLAVERPPSTSHMGDSANTSGFKTKIFVSSKPGIETLISLPFNDVACYAKFDQSQILIKASNLKQFPIHFLIIFFRFNSRFRGKFSFILRTRPCFRFFVKNK